MLIIGFWVALIIGIIFLGINLELSRQSRTGKNNRVGIEKMMRAKMAMGTALFMFMVALFFLAATLQ